MTAKNRLRILSCNINSLQSKKHLLLHTIDETDPHVLCLQETRNRHEIRIPNYREIANTQPGKKASGNRGSRLLVKTGITATKENMDDYTIPRLELTAADIHLPGERPIRIINTYVSHTLALGNPQERKDKLKNLTNAIIDHPRALSIGDQNCKLVMDQHTDTNRLGDTMEELLDEEDLTAIASTEYTRYDPAGREPSTIDIAITKSTNKDMIEDILVLPCIGSDHRPVLYTIPIGSEIEPKIVTKKPNFTKADWISYREQSRQQILKAPKIEPKKATLDEGLMFVAQAVDTAEATHIPRYSIRTGRKKRELPPHIVEKIDKRRKLKNRLDKHGEYHLKPEINTLNEQIKELIDEFEEQKICKQWEATEEKSKYAFYKTARKILKTQDSDMTYPIKNKDGVIITDNKEKIAEFTKLYKEIYTPPPRTPESAATERLANAAYEEVTREYEEVKMRPPSLQLDQTVTVEKIRKELSKTKNTAPGEDGIHYTHLKNLPDETLEYLAKLYETAWRCGYYFDDCKMAAVTLLPKPGKDKTQPKNYRPLSLLSVLGKLFERLINTELNKFLEANNLLPETQAGFRKNRSTQDQLMKLIQDIAKAQNTGGTVVATLFDIEKAYDKVWHQLATLKFQRIGLDPQTVGLLTNYLRDRSIRIKIKGELGEKVALQAGTPQGAILSPTIFNICVYDIPQPTKNHKLSQFADDIGTWVNHRNELTARDQLQIFNDKLILWCKTNRILLSPAKTQVIAFATGTNINKMNPNAIYQIIDGVKIKGSKSVTFLGVILDQKLNMKEHHRKVMNELKRRTAVFSNITGTEYKPRASTDISLKILKSMIESVAYYAPSVTTIQTDKMFKEQDNQIRQCTKLALHVHRSTSNRYVNNLAKMTESKIRTNKLAKNYLTSDKRSESVKDYIQQYMDNRTTIRWKIRSPLTILKE